MKVAALITRINYYRQLGPIVEESLRRGWETEVWHDYGQPRGGRFQDGHKGYLFPEVDQIPAFHSGAPTVRRFYGLEGLKDLLRAPEAPPVVITSDPPPHGIKDVARVKWWYYPNAIDIMFQNLDEVLEADTIGMLSDYWIGLFEQKWVGHPRVGDFRSKCVVVGYTLVDPYGPVLA